MTRTLIWFGVFGFAVVLATHREGWANHLDSTAWAWTGTSTLKITGRPRTPPQASEFMVAVDASSHVVLTSAEVTFGGSYVDKGKRGFQVLPDAAAIEAVTQYLTDQLVQETGATAIDIEKTKIKVGGAVSKDGSTLTAKMKASIKGSATIDDRRARGKVTITGSYSGTKQS